MGRKKKQKRICIIYTLPDGDLNTWERTAIVESLLIISKEFNIDKVEYIPELKDWRVENMHKEIREEIKEIEE